MVVYVLQPIMNSLSGVDTCAEFISLGNVLSHKAFVLFSKASGTKNFVRHAILARGLIGSFTVHIIIGAICSIKPPAR